MAGVGSTDVYANWSGIFQKLKIIVLSLRSILLFINMDMSVSRTLDTSILVKSIINQRK
jgi:hypothetical protein